MAVLLVVIDHARFPYLPGGFLGVDIFFVISGYMITGLVVDEIDSRSFSFRAFYARRARRLFPAAYATIIITVLAAAVLLDPYEFDNLIYQVVGAFTFTINFVLWRQVDYFNSGAALKPLLHMWSLSIEEQFYIFLPIALLLCPARWRLLLLSGATIASAVLCLYLLPRSPSATFYFLPFRAWELGIGCVVSALARRYSGPWHVHPLARAILATILCIVPVFASERGHPGYVALIVCVTTALLLATSGQRQASAPLEPLVALGDRSYSLYLVHWPVISLANNVFISVVPGPVNALLLGVIAALTELQYRCIERPIRNWTLTPRGCLAFVLIPAVVLMLMLVRTETFKQAGDFRRENTGLGRECNYKRYFDPLPSCQTTEKPQTIVWGDSFAMHLMDALKPTIAGGLLQATKTVCGPFLEVAPVDGKEFTEAWGKGCLDFNASVMDYLLHHPEISTVVLSSSLLQYLPQGEDAPWKALVVENGHSALKALDTGRIVDDLARTSRILRGAGKHVAWIAPPPSLGFNIGRCLSRYDNDDPSISPFKDCSFKRADYEQARRPVFDFLGAVSARHLATVVSFDSWLCDSGTCRPRLAGVNLYQDAGHLSVPGSAMLGAKMQLGRLVQRSAQPN